MKEPTIPFRVVVYRERCDYHQRPERAIFDFYEGPDTADPYGMYHRYSKIIDVHRLGGDDARAERKTLLGDLLYWMTIQRLAFTYLELEPCPWSAEPEERAGSRPKAEAKNDDSRDQVGSASRWKAGRSRFRALEVRERIGCSVWLEVGLAEYFRGCAAPEDQGRNPARLSYLCRSLRRGERFSLSQLFQCRSLEEADMTFRIRFGRGTHQEGRTLLSAQAWSFVHFALRGTFPRSRESFLAFVRKSAARESFGYETLMACFGLDSVNDTAWSVIEPSWRKHVDSL